MPGGNAISVPPQFGTAPSADASCTRDIDPFLFEYGEVSFCVETAWLERYVSEQRWSSSSSALATLLPDYSARRISETTVRNLLHCWNIASEPTNGVTWNVFWADGGPINFYTMMVQLAQGFADEAVDEWSGTGACDGFSVFLSEVLKGRSALNSPLHHDHRRCDLRIFVRSTDTRFPQEAQGCVDAEDGKDPKRCGLSFDWATEADCSHPFDSWTPTWWRGAYGYYWQAVPGYSNAAYRPKMDCVPMAIGGGFGVVFHASWIAFEGFLADYLMFWARVALDYGNERGSLLHLEAASRIARFVLSRVAEFSRWLIHEVGHCFLGGGHCTHGCCFDIASEAWWCAVRARLGLIFRTGELSYSEAGNVASGATGCGTDDKIKSTIYYYCDVRNVGVSGQDAIFASTRCSFGSATTSTSTRPDLGEPAPCVGPHCPESEVFPDVGLP